MSLHSQAAVVTVMTGSRVNGITVITATWQHDKRQEAARSRFFSSDSASARTLRYAIPYPVSSFLVLFASCASNPQIFDFQRFEMSWDETSFISQSFISFFFSFSFFLPHSPVLSRHVFASFFTGDGCFPVGLT